MDYWDYIAHSQQGAERKDHRYYARVQTGNRNGRATYRYFYTAEEYAAYKNAANRSMNRQKNLADRAKARTGILAAKVQMDADRYRKRKREATREGIAKEKRSMDQARTREGIRKQKAQMDRQRRRTGILAEKVQMDAKRTRSERRDSARAKRIGEQHSMDRQRWKNEARKGHQASIANQKKELDRARHRSSIADQKKALDRARHKASVTAQKVELDAKRYRRKKRAAAKKNRDFAKRVMDNTRTRKGYQPKMV